jgi:hypothetical protein
MLNHDTRETRIAYSRNINQVGKEGRNIVYVHECCVGPMRPTRIPQITTVVLYKCCREGPAEYDQVIKVSRWWQARFNFPNTLQKLPSDSRPFNYRPIDIGFKFRPGDGVFFYFVGWGETESLVRRPLIGLLYQPRIDEYGAFGGMRLGRGN